MKKEFHVEGWKVENSIFLERRRGFRRKKWWLQERWLVGLEDEKRVDFVLI